MEKKETKETWQDALQNFKLQLEHCQERVRTYKHLLATQQEPGNLPAALGKWQRLENTVQELLEKHQARGKRWGFLKPGYGAV